MSLKPELLDAIRHRTARVAIGPSTLRGAGNTGAVEVTRRFLEQLDLRHFGTSSDRRYMEQLDEATLRLKRRLPKGARHWGLARKSLNIFLRDCLYNVYLSDGYRLARAEPLLELPLDSITGKRLSELADGALPRWETIKGLKRDRSDEFQEFAAVYAAKNGIARVHLDAFWWAGFSP
jgi:hypothetical protein